MEEYNYKQSMVKDIKEYIIENYPNFKEENSLLDRLNDELWGEDSITGNGIDFYDSEYKCEEYICHNLDTALEAFDEWGIDIERVKENARKGCIARYIDCTIRCYCLYECIETALEELGYEEV